MKLLRPLRERDFALLWTGMTVSLLGDGIFIVAEAWQVYDIENDPVALSLVGLAWTGGMTAFLLTGGIVSDRMERRKVLIAADLVRADRRHAALHRLRLRHDRVAAHGLRGRLRSGRDRGDGRVGHAHVLARAELRGRVRSLDWFVSIGLTPIFFALTGPVSKAIGTDATLVLAGVLAMGVCAVLYVVAGLHHDEERHPLLGEAYAGVGASWADSGSGTPAIS